MKKLFSQMTPEELQTEMKLLQSEMQRVEFPSQRSVLERKYFAAMAYTLNPADYPPGLYKVDGVQLPFEVHYVNGIMAWGKLGQEPDASFPISMLARLS
ncbi:MULTISPECIES: DUF1811 family protein [unclassified Paenibacillus]|uniref:DUF1811 family protein n=1 Tax=unclassified Paenibacillus TaxID=185978 RepID=UPI001AE529CF|nr:MULTISPECIES: DUF1811 family protein [unclassified Paenibacillus]MBP1156177.1 hypothetical protein [Paenibacillus sp. PvP091]MBP1168437.1 hypothetical protein [Paenibacillus sp. PvR098]MBP2439465.1 hypothetical protein [Paenibacillus sp. PvP052]